MTEPGSYDDLRPQQTRRPRWLLPGLVAVVVLALSGGAVALVNVATDSSTTTTSTSTTSTTREQRVAEWARASMPYIPSVLAAFEGVQAAAATNDIDRMKAAVRTVADAMRTLRLSLETAGPPPAVAVVEARAVIESVSDYEAAARRFGDCLVLVRELRNAQDSWGQAVAALTAKMSAAV